MKRSFYIFLFYSLFIHAAVFCSFYRVIKGESEDFTRDFSVDTVDVGLDEYEFVDQDFLRSVLSPFMDSATIDSLWQEDSMYVKEWAAFSGELQNIMEPQWYGSMHERARALHDLLDKYREKPSMDSLFAQSEFLRDALLKQVRKNLEKYGNKGVPGELDWKRMIEGLAEFLKQAYGDYDLKASGKSKSKWVAEVIKRSLQDEWPEGFFELSGKWEDDVGPEEILDRIRKEIGEHDKRESLL